jgi:hypothetical protein
MMLFVLFTDTILPPDTILPQLELKDRLHASMTAFTHVGKQPLAK